MRQTAPIEQREAAMVYGIFGAGGFGREVMPVAREALEIIPSRPELVFVVDEPQQSELHGYRVMSSVDFLGMPEPGCFNIAVADHVARRAIAQRFIAAGAQPFPIIAQTNRMLGPSRIGPGAILCANTVVTSDATIGAFFHANLGSYVAHDCVIGDFVSFAPSVHCNGRVVIEDDVYVGTGAIIRNGTPDRPMVIGRGAVIGMGAVVTKSVPAGATVVGNPARPLC